MATGPLNYLLNVVAAILLVQLALGLNLSQYTKPSKEVGKRLRSYDPRKDPGYPHELGFGHYYQGDILLRPKNKGGRIAVGDPLTFDKWSKGIVPYVLKANFNDGDMKMLQAAFDEYATKTCVRFVARTNEVHYVTIKNDDTGCYSTVGRSPYSNELNLQTPGCMDTVGTPVHEMMHTLGFYHEQSRYDRDDYIEINTDNLRPEYQSEEFIAVNFGKYDTPNITDYGVPYNYASVMHYSRLAGAVAIDRPVLTNLQLFFGDFGNEAGLSDGDVKQIMARYC